MTGTPYQKTITMQLAASVVNGIAQSQSKGSAGNFTLNGSLVTAGVATLDSNGNARRVLFTFAGDETGHNFTITGTGWNGLAQTEVVAGTSTTAQSTKDFKTVSKVSVDAATTSTVQIGTNGVGSSLPFVCDAIISRADYACGVTASGTVNYTIEESYDDLGPAWDINSASPTWFADSNFTSKTSNTNGVLNGPFTMIRLTINSGTGSATARIITPMGTGPF